MALDVDFMFSRRARRAVERRVALASCAAGAASGRGGAGGDGGSSGGGAVVGVSLWAGREAAYARVIGRGVGSGAERRLGRRARGKRVSAGQVPVQGREANARVIMNCVAVDDAFRLAATKDAADRAHRQMVAVKSELGGMEDLYVPAAGRRGRPARNVMATPRRYDRSQITSRGVAFDSMFDGLYLAQLRLAGVRGLGRGATVADERTRVLARLDGIRPGLARAVTNKAVW